MNHQELAEEILISYYIDPEVPAEIDSLFSFGRTLEVRIYITDAGIFIPDLSTFDRKTLDYQVTPEVNFNHYSIVIKSSGLMSAYTRLKSIFLNYVNNKMSFHDQLLKNLLDDTLFNTFIVLPVTNVQNKLKYVTMDNYWEQRLRANPSSIFQRKTYQVSDKFMLCYTKDGKLHEVTPTVKGFKSTSTTRVEVDQIIPYDSTEVKFFIVSSDSDRLKIKQLYEMTNALTLSN